MSTEHTNTHTVYTQSSSHMRSTDEKIMSVTPSCCLDLLKVHLSYDSVEVQSTPSAPSSHRCASYTRTELYQTETRTCTQHTTHITYVAQKFLAQSSGDFTEIFQMSKVEEQRLNTDSNESVCVDESGGVSVEVK